MSERELTVSDERIAGFCRKRHIARLSFFGSVLREDFREDSDVDALVEFEPGRVPGLIRLGGMANELSGILGRRVDLRTPEDLSPYFRDEVVGSARPLYVKP
jgi:uncharacterized protein